MGAGGVAPGVPREHPRQLDHASSPVTAVAVVTVRPRAAPFTHPDLRVGLRGDLGQVGDDQDLALARHLVERLAQGHRGSAAHAGVDLVEDHGLGPAQAHQPDGQHRPGQLAARGGPGQRLHRLADVGPEQELHRLAGALRASRDLQAGAGHGQAASRSPTCVPKCAGGLGPDRPHDASASASSAALRPLGRQPGRLALRVLEGGQASRASSPNAITAEVLAVLAPQLPEQAPALLHRGQALRVVLPALDLVAQRAGQVGELDRRARPGVAVRSRRPPGRPARPPHTRAGRGRPLAQDGSSRSAAPSAASR